MNVGDLKQLVQDVGGIPERGEKGRLRFLRILNLVRKTIWKELPTALLSEEIRIQLEPPLDNLTVQNTSDVLVFELQGPWLPTGPALPRAVQDLRGRTLEILTAEGEYIYRRIRDVWDNQTKYFISVDEPWSTTVVASYSARIFTREYPYPHDVSAIHQVWYAPERGPNLEIQPLTRPQLDQLNFMNNWRDIGQPQGYSRGDTYQLRSPRYIPEVGLRGGQEDDEKWGYNPTNGNEHGNLNGNSPFYGVAGTFSYRVCEVWGRRPWPNAMRDEDNGQPPLSMQAPFLISAPSEPSAKQATTWAGPGVAITTPDIDYLDGYGHNNTYLSYKHGGFEKWIFRARHLTQAAGAGNNAYEPRVPADNEYVLWQIIPGWLTEVYDHGQHDPPGEMTLKDMVGHMSLRLDRLPSEAKFLLLHVTRRLSPLVSDADALRVPPECEDLLINLMSAYMLGKADGEPDRESHYYMVYLKAVEDLRAAYALPGHDQQGFGYAFDGDGHHMSFSDFTDLP